MARRSSVWVMDVPAGSARLVLETADIHLEAPNWTPDGSLILNGDGKLWRLSSAGGTLTEIPLTGVPALNNDHVLDPDGVHIYLSANDGDIYRAPLAGGAAVRVTHAPPLMHFLHGVSPDGTRLAFIGIDPAAGWSSGEVYTVGTDGLSYERFPGSPADGCEYSPDGSRIYFNSEVFDGHAQIARMHPSGTDLTQLTFDDSVNWFPHLPPTGPYAVYVAFPPGTTGHPPDVWVDLMLVTAGDWPAARSLGRVFGGQGTMNVNSWSPDGLSFAYVSYDR